MPQIARNCIGMQLVDTQDQIKGQITNQYFEDGKWILVADDSWELPMSDTSIIVDLCGTTRAKNPAIQPEFLRMR